MSVRRWIVRRLGGEWYEDDWYDYDGDEDSWSFSFRLHNLFRRRNTIISNVTNERVVDMDSAITMLDPDVSQFETMLMKVARAGAAATKVEWLEDDFMPMLQWRFADPRDDFGFPSTWDDTPRKPKVRMTHTGFGYKLAYGTIVSVGVAQNDSLLRYLGGEWWERVG